MQQIKFLKDNQIRLGTQVYKGYTVGNLPKSFGFIYNEDEDKEGKSEWFKYKGLTYVPKTELPW
tara:strand:- start:314 stop:505 length:192 start_codon:yes stop_codon:yes gene_type:complete